MRALPSATPWKRLVGYYHCRLICHVGHGYWSFALLSWVMAFDIDMLLLLGDFLFIIWQ